MAHGISQARGQIRAASVSLHHSHINVWDLSYVFGLHHSSWQCQILDPLRKTRDQTHIFMDTSWFLNQLSHNGSSRLKIFLSLGDPIMECKLWEKNLYKKCINILAEGN